MRKLGLTLLALFGTYWLHAPLRAEDPDGIAFFEKTIRPLFVENCLRCHGSNPEKIKGGLRLDRRAGWLKGGDSGPAIVPKDPEKSPLIHAVRRNHSTISAMPPDQPLTKQQIDDLIAWVRRGAPAPEDPSTIVERPAIDFAAAQQRWPYTKLPEKISIPSVNDRSWPRTAIDQFILAKLESAGLHPVEDADRRTLIRRVTFDLIGLPPTPEETDAFIGDTNPNAFEKVVDRLLASPHYGERWGRHWLDVVRYADTAGDNSDYPIPQMHRYRDWVIDAFNRDLPYDQFIREQIAGDLIGGTSDSERYRRIIATGYIANARRFGSRVDDYPQHLTIEDTLDNLGRAFLGLTLNCARCHDHKFDPITMKDYYALYGIFHSTRYPWPGIELDKRQRDLIPLAGKEQIEQEEQRRSSQISKIDKEIQYLRIGLGFSFSPERRKDYQKRIDALKKSKDALRDSPWPFPMAYAVTDAKTIADVPIQLKGNPEQPGEVVPRRFLTALGGQRLAPDDHGSGRLSLANWVASESNPLTARVMANRIWHYHFHRGLVATPNDFGKQGRAPTHPELLDYLARTLIEKGWSIKAMHRMIVLSRVYQLASVSQVANVTNADSKDANNDLIWKFRRQRLDAESIRDAMLFVSGQLNPAPGGPHPFPEPSKWNFTQHLPFRATYDHNHRSVYLMTQRIQRHPFLAIFDGPDTGASTASRTTSTTTLQSLYLLNDSFVHLQAREFARRIRSARSDDRERIDWAFRTALARSATVDEQNRAIKMLQHARELTDPNAAWESFARTLLRLNEFVYVE